MRILNPPISLYGLMSAVFLWAAVPSGFAKPAERPNIVLILCDDMGWSDIGCYGGEVNTPSLDRLAAVGVVRPQGRPDGDE